MMLVSRAPGGGRSFHRSVSSTPQSAVVHRRFCAAVIFIASASRSTAYFHRRSSVAWSWAMTGGGSENAERFSLAAPARASGCGKNGHRRDGGLKTRWTKPLRRRCAMGIEWRPVSNGTWDVPSGQVPRELIRGVGAGQGDERVTSRQRTRGLRWGDEG